MATRKILTVDDSATDRALYQRLLRRPVGPERFTVLEASSGTEALDLYRAERPDCVLLDYNLPDSDGLTLLRELTAVAPPDSLCAIVITGVGNENVATAALTNGALDYLVKQQFDAELLYKTIVFAIERNEARQRLTQSHAETRAVNAELQQSLRELATAREELASRNHQLTAANALINARNQSLADTNDRLTRVNVDLDNFIYTASHDLRAPIVNIEGLLIALVEELYDAPTQSPDAGRIIGLMQQSVERFKKTIEDLTDVVRLQKANDLPAQRVSLADVVRDVQLDIAPLLQETGATVEVDVMGCPDVFFTEKNLRSIVYNLLSNAVKYRSLERPARVRVGCAVHDGFTILTVQDNGLGIDLSSGRPLFAMFQRFHSHVEGSGIGLYMVKRIVENAGGRIEVESEVGSGTTFRVYFRQ